jgi:hypothetical protein
MGMPDSFVYLESSVREHIKQIGNSVPVPLALDLGLELLKVLVDKFEEEQQHSGSVKKEASSREDVNAGHGQGNKDDPIIFDSDDEFVEVD